MPNNGRNYGVQASNRCRGHVSFKVAVAVDQCLA
jgi:hypothetical protein